MIVDGLRPARVTLVSTQSGRNALLLALSGLAATAPFGSWLAVLPIGALFAMLLPAPLIWLALRRLRVAPPDARTVRTGSMFEFPLEIRHVGLGPGVRDLLLFAGADGPSASRPLGWIERLNSKQRVVATCEWRTRRRGRRTRLELVLASSFPLGWWQARAKFQLPIDWLSLPRVARLDGDVEREPRRRRNVGRVSSARRGDEEFHALRDARPGDSPHWVHWRSTARRGKLVVREMRSEERPRKNVVLLGWTDRPLDASGTNEAFEQAVSLAAALVERHAQRGETTNFTFEGRRPWTLVVAGARSSVPSLLARLALVECATLEDRGHVDFALARHARSEARLVHACAKLPSGWVGTRSLPSTAAAIAEPVDARRMRGMATKGARS